MGDIMDDTTTSAVLARRVRDQILFYPESHQQNIVAVGEVVDEVELVNEVELPGQHHGDPMDVIRPTKGCVAGWACHFNGDLILMPRRDHDYSVDERSKENWDYYMRHALPDAGPARVAVVCGSDGGKLIYATRRAAELLGLARVECEWLFAGERTREEVLHALDLLGKGDRDAFRTVVLGPGYGDANDREC